MARSSRARTTRRSSHMRSMSASSSLVGTIPFPIRRWHRDQSQGVEGFLNPRTPSSRPGLRSRVSSSRGMTPFWIRDPVAIRYHDQMVRQNRWRSQGAEPPLTTPRRQLVRIAQPWPSPIATVRVAPSTGRRRGRIPVDHQGNAPKTGKRRHEQCVEIDELDGLSPGSNGL